MFRWVLHRGCDNALEQAIIGYRHERDERKKLEAQLPNLLGQIQEQKGIVDYTMHDKEQEIAKLKKELEECFTERTAAVSRCNQLTKQLKDQEENTHLALIKVQKLEHAAVGVKNYNKTMDELNAEIVRQKRILVESQCKDALVIENLTKRNEELEAWGNRLAVEATQELTGNKPKQPSLSKSQLKSMRQAWEDDELSKLKIVKKK